MNFDCWAAGTWAAGTWAVNSWCPGSTPAPSAGNYVQRVIGRTARAEDFIQADVIDYDALRRIREEEEIIIL